jgi:hypothetical protein
VSDYDVLVIANNEKLVWRITGFGTGLRSEIRRGADLAG